MQVDPTLVVCHKVEVGRRHPVRHTPAILEALDKDVSTPLAMPQVLSQRSSSRISCGCAQTYIASVRLSLIHRVQLSFNMAGVWHVAEYRHAIVTGANPKALIP